MSESRKAGSIILANLAMFNEAVLLFEEKIQPKIFEKLDVLFEEYLNPEKWIRECEFHNEGETWFSPLEWQIENLDEATEAKAWFSLEFNHGEGNSFDLADLSGVGQDEMGITFKIKPSQFGGKTKWNNFTKTIPSSLGNKLQTLGFRDFGKGVFFIPIKLNPSLLASAWENEDYEELMQPVIVVLENIKQSVAIFNELFSLAKQAGLGRIE